MIGIKIKAAPFGIREKRFFDLGFHPGFETRPDTRKYSRIFPGCYSSVRPRKIISKLSRWKKELQVEEFSRRMGYHCDHILKRRQWLSSINGPGWQEVRSHSEKTFTFPKAKRFAHRKSLTAPGPGAYGKNHVPYTVIEEKSHSKGFSFSTIPSFEHRSCGRSFGIQRAYHLPPNLYNIKGCIDELIMKKVSKKGPYDLFSGARFPSKPTVDVELFPALIHSSSWNHPKNQFKGKFYKCGKDDAITSRMVLKYLSVSKKDPLAPGPNYYDPYPAIVVTKAKYPFHSNVLEARPTVKCMLHPPPGRYNPDSKKRILGDGFKCNFTSKTKRDLFKKEKHSWFE